MSENSQVGIVIRTKDRPLLLRRALEGILNQTYPHWLIRIVNDGGDPAVVDALLNELSERLQGRAKVLHNPQSTGMQNASNQGVADFETEFLIIHDDDDSLEPTFFEETVAFLKNPPFENCMGVITHSLRIVERIEGESIVRLEEHPGFNSWLAGRCVLYQFLEHNHFPPISFLFRRSAFDAIGQFQQEWNPVGDWEFNVRFLVSYDIGIIPKLLANYHHRAPNTTSGEYGNSITAPGGHGSYENALRNHWLREDLKQGRVGLGVIAGLALPLKNLDSSQRHLTWLCNEKIPQTIKQATQPLRETLGYQIRKFFKK